MLCFLTSVCRQNGHGGIDRPHVLAGPVVIHLTASGDLERLGKSFAPGTRWEMDMFYTWTWHDLAVSCLADGKQSNYTKKEITVWVLSFDHPDFFVSCSVVFGFAFILKPTRLLVV